MRCALAPAALTPHVRATGARADSLYEYFLKQWIMSRGTDVLPKQLYDDSVISMFKNVRKRPHTERRPV